MKQHSRVRDHMATAVETVSPDLEIMQLVRRLVEKNISGAVVIDTSGRLAGVITERDCIAVASKAGYFDERAGRVADFMTTDVETVSAEDNLMDVAQRLSASQHRTFPVVDEAGSVLGLLSRRDVLKALTSGTWFSAQPGR